MLKKTWNRLISIRSGDDLLVMVKILERVFNKWSSAIQPLSWWKNVVIAVPRIYVGFLLLSTQWRLKMGMPVNQLQEMLHENKMTSEWLTTVGPDLLFWLDKAEGLALGGFMVTGLNTRLTALSILWTMTERVFLSLVHPLTSSFMMTLLAIVAGYSLIIGSGKLGADYWIVRLFRQKRAKKQKNSNHTSNNENHH